MNPVNRWYPVLLRYVGLVESRVNGLGGNAGSVSGSLTGVPPLRPGQGCGWGKKHHPHPHHHCGDDHVKKCGCGHHKHHGQGSGGGEPEYHGGCVGKISCVAFDNCGRFEEFCVREEVGAERRFLASRKEGFDELVRKAWGEKWVVEVLVDEEGDPTQAQVAKGIVLRG